MVVADKEAVILASWRHRRLDKPNTPPQYRGGGKWKDALRRLLRRQKHVSRQSDSVGITQRTERSGGRRDVWDQRHRADVYHKGATSKAPGDSAKTDPIEDLAWMVDEDDEPRTPEIADPAVAAAFEDLLGDWTRKGNLTRGEVAMLAATRRLSAAQVSDVIRYLESAGVEVSSARATVEIPRQRTGENVVTNRWSRDLDLLSLYLDEISRFPLLTAQREVELWALREDGLAAQVELEANGGGMPHEEADQLRRRVYEGRRAWEELVCSNLRLVVSIASHRRYEGCGVDLPDRIQGGNLGLMRAADKFDGSKGYKFSTYATWWIRQSIEREIANTGRAIRLPVHVLETMGKVRRVAQRLTHRLGREPTIEEIAEGAELEPGAVAALLDVMRPVASLDMLLGDGGDLRLSDVILNDDNRDGRTDPANIVIESLHRAEIERAMSAVLSEREVTIVKRRHGFHTDEPETLEAIALDYGVTRERIRQIAAKSLDKLRDNPQLQAIYLGEVATTQVANWRSAG